MINRFHAGLLLFLAGCSGPTSEAAKEINERAAANATGQVQVSNVSGDISVSGWDKNEVEVRGTLGRGSELKFERDGRRTTVKVKKEDGERRQEATTLLLKIPQGSELIVNGVSSDIKVNGVQGVQRLETVSGDVTADIFAGDIEAKTVSGDVRVEGNGSSTLVTVTSISGDSEIFDVAGEIESTTVSGEITVRAGTLKRTRLKAMNGDITVEADLARDSRFETETLNGDVNIDFEEGSHLDADIETFNGDIDNCFGQQSERKSKHAPGRTLRFTRGDGDRHVRIKTMNGDVDICSKQGN